MHFTLSRHWKHFFLHVYMYINFQFCNSIVKQCDAIVWACTKPQPYYVSNVRKSYKVVLQKVKSYCACTHFNYIFGVFNSFVRSIHELRNGKRDTAGFLQINASLLYLIVYDLCKFASHNEGCRLMVKVTNVVSLTKTPHYIMTSKNAV